MIDVECVLSSFWRYWLCTWDMRVCLCLRCGWGVLGFLGFFGVER